MLRRPLLVAAALSLLVLGVQQSSGASGPRNGRIAYGHVGNADRFQIYTVTPTGARRSPLTRSRRSSSSTPSYSPNGKRIVFVRAYRQSDLWTMRSDGSHQRQLTNTPVIGEEEPAWSPNGMEIVFAVAPTSPFEGIWVIGRDGTRRRRLTTGQDTDPSWSPDGGKIAFDRYDANSQTWSIFVVPAAGGTATELASEPGYSEFEPAWSPNGSRILFVSDRGDPDPQESADQLDLWVMNADGSDAARVTNTPSRDERDPAWSPDGRRIVYSGEGAFHGASSSQIYVSRANGTKRRILTHACGECAYINDEPSWQRLPG